LVWDWPALPEALGWLGGSRAANAARPGDSGYGDLSGEGPTLVVNTTPLGMWPRTRSSPLSAADVRRLPRDCAVVDLIYRPRETLLIQRAQAAGLPTLGGAEMLVRQGAASLALWLGRDPGAPALEAMRQGVEAALAEEVSRDAASGNRR